MLYIEVINLMLFPSRICALFPSRKSTYMLFISLYFSYLVSTLAKTEMIYPKNVRAKVAMDFT